MSAIFNSSMKEVALFFFKMTLWWSCYGFVLAFGNFFKFSLNFNVRMYPITKGSSPVFGSVSCHHMLPPLPPPGDNSSYFTTSRCLD